jgi:hypothetical protein
MHVVVMQAGIAEGENEAASASHDLTRASFEYVKVLPRGVTRSNCWLQGLCKATRNAGHLHDCMAEHRHPHTFMHCELCTDCMHRRSHTPSGLAITCRCTIFSTRFCRGLSVLLSPRAHRTERAVVHARPSSAMPPAAITTGVTRANDATDPSDKSRFRSTRTSLKVHDGLLASQAHKRLQLAVDSERWEGYFIALICSKRC